MSIVRVGEQPKQLSAAELANRWAEGVFNIYYRKLLKLQLLSMNLPDEFYSRLTRVRGGCRCMDPNARPPCGPCTNEMTNAEASEVLQSFVGELPKVQVLELQQLLIDADYDPEL